MDDGRCYLYSQLSTETTDSTTSTDLYTTSAKVYPSQTVSACTHLQQWSAEKVVRDACTAKTEKATCYFNSCGWKEVRNVIQGTTWFEAADRLSGTAVYGTPNVSTNNWSV